jgi:beta-lactamase regulating signal transducer with metallopeptidase domain
VAADGEALAHVLAHEETHYHHKDHIWSLLRCICLVVHWYNPLVWLAAALSRRDSELACDEGAIRRLGEEQRAAYGRTLIGLTCTGAGRLLRTATTMTGSKKSIKERIVLIAKKPKMKIYTLVAVILIAAIAAGCTFTGKETEQQRVVSWMASLEKEDLEQARWMFMDGGTAEMPLVGADGAEGLYSILQQVKEEDLLEKLLKN